MSLPALRPPPPRPQPQDTTFFPLLLAWLLFPLHAPLTLLLLDAPFGKFAVDSWGNVGGCVGWVAMEMVAPVTFILNLPAHISPDAATLAGLYLMHYAHRALISPLVLAPTRAPIHAVVVLAAMVFNYFNATLLARALGMFPPAGGWTFYAGVGLWGVGFLGNIYHDEILHDLRRPAGQTLVSTPSEDAADRHPNGRYRIPRGGLFTYISFPNYFCEWIEWTGFAIAAAPTLLVAVPPGAFSTVLVLGHTFDLSRFAGVVPPRLLAPAWAFVLAEITSMLPRAVRGHRWYVDTFKHYPKDRKVVIPGVL